MNQQAGTPYTFTHFQLQLLKQENQVGFCVLLTLAWLATCDGHLDRRERDNIESVAASSGHSQEINLIIELAKSADVENLALVLDILQNSLDNKQKLLLLELGIGMIIADTKVTISENHVLRLVADSIGVTSEELAAAFKYITSRELPYPSDPSMSSYWKLREGEQTPPRTKQEPMSLLSALAILGLSSEATSDEVKDSYRRLAKIHHPDRYTSLGEEAVAAANTTFSRINSAYEYITAYA